MTWNASMPRENDAGIDTSRDLYARAPTDLDTIRAMLTRAGVVFETTPDPINGGTELEIASSGGARNFGLPSHSALLNFDAKGALVSVEVSSG